MSTRATPFLRSRGLSLIELLVAVALGGILMGGAISLFVNNRATYEITNDMARLQENARFALQILTEDVRMAGYNGCINDFTKVNDNVTTVLTGVNEGDLASFAHGVEAFESSEAQWLPLGQVRDSATYAANSDGITVRYFGGDRSKDAPPDPADAAVNNEVVNKSPDDASESNPVLAVRDLDFTPAPVAGQLFAVGDCGSSDVFTIDGFGNLTIDGENYGTITASGLQRSYDSLHRALVAPAVAVRYFVANNDNGIPSLFRASLAQATPAAAEAPEELVDGVESLQLLYGVDSDQDGLPNAFLSAGDSIPDPADPTRTVELLDRNDFLSVVAVKIALLMRTVDEFGDVPDDIVYDVGEERFCRAGLVVVPACTVALSTLRVRRRVFQTTVAVRNFQ